MVNTLQGSSRCPLALLLRSPDTREEDPQPPVIQAEAIPVIRAVSIRAKANQAALRASIQDRASPVTHQVNILAPVTANRATLAVSIRGKANLSPVIPADDILHRGSRITHIRQVASILVREDRVILPDNIQVEVRVILEVSTPEVTIQVVSTPEVTTQVASTPEVATLAEEATQVVVIRALTRAVTLQPCTPLSHLKSPQVF